MIAGLDPGAEDPHRSRMIAGLDPGAEDPLDKTKILTYTVNGKEII